ncbi:hypothetical protein C8R43DRAFT_1043544 [Mycena crocata]|nr:hypothetical protein C8R43DRAFT_1043544 [Mycena crocata]
MQFVFSIRPPPLRRPDVVMPAPPNAKPPPLFLERFWRRVSEITTRYYDRDHKWIGGEEIKLWNEQNRWECAKCVNSRLRRICIIDEDLPSCRACRANKIGCDRKPHFVFDMTKADFFPTYAQFIGVYNSREPGQLRRYPTHVGRIRRDTQERDKSTELKGELEDVINELKAKLDLVIWELSETKRAADSAFDDMAPHVRSVKHLLCRFNGGGELLEPVRSLVRAIETHLDKRCETRGLSTSQ